MDLFGMFVKYWEPGRVKTRLAEHLGARAAAEVYHCFVATLARRFQRIGDERQIVLTPAGRRAEIEEEIGENWRIGVQSHGDLGQRMHCFFACAFESGSNRAVLIGSDSPTIPTEMIHRSYRELETHPVVLGPSADGGYYLIGVRDEVPPVFDGIDWGTSCVWEQTVERLRGNKTHFAQLPEWYDVDEISDLRKLHNELQQLVTSDSSWRDLLNIVGSELEISDS